MWICDYFWKQLILLFWHRYVFTQVYCSWSITYRRRFLKQSVCWVSVFLNLKILKRLMNYNLTNERFVVVCVVVASDLSTVTVCVMSWARCRSGPAQPLSSPVSLSGPRAPARVTSPTSHQPPSLTSVNLSDNKHKRCPNIECLSSEK